MTLTFDTWTNELDPDILSIDLYRIEGSHVWPFSRESGSEMNCNSYVTSVVNKIYSILFYSIGNRQTDTHTQTNNVKHTVWLTPLVKIESIYFMYDTLQVTWKSNG